MIITVNEAKEILDSLKAGIVTIQNERLSRSTINKLTASVIFLTDALLREEREQSMRATLDAQNKALFNQAAETTALERDRELAPGWDKE